MKELLAHVLLVFLFASVANAEPAFTESVVFELSFVETANHTATISSTSPLLNGADLALFPTDSGSTPFVVVPPTASLLPEPFISGSALSLTVFDAITFTTAAATALDGTNLILFLVTSPALLGGPQTSGFGFATRTFAAPRGVVIVPAAEGITVDAAVESLTATITSPDTPPNLVATVDFMAKAASVGSALPPCTLLAFGTPLIGFPVWSTAPPAGLELPLEVLVFESRLGRVYFAYNAPAGLGTRFGIGEEDEAARGSLTAADGALAAFVSAAAGVDVEPAGLDYDVDRLPGLLEGLVVKKRSEKDVGEVFANVLDAIDEIGLDVEFKVQHDVSAEKLGIDVMGLKNRVVVFGSAEEEVAAIQSSLTIALDLPIKMSVWIESAGSNRVSIGYNDITYLLDRHGAAAVDIAAKANMTQADIARAGFK